MKFRFKVGDKVISWKETTLGVGRVEKIQQNFGVTKYQVKFKEHIRWMMEHELTGGDYA